MEMADEKLNPVVRCFLALPLAEFESEVRPLISQFKQTYPKIRWIEVKNIHITLHFFGSIPSDQVKEISDLVIPITQVTRPFEMSLQGLGAFPNLHLPRVIWIGASGSVKELENLQDELERRFKAKGFPCEGRKFKPHLTIGRVKDLKVKLRPDFIGGFTTPLKRINGITLFQSSLTPQGPQYEVLKYFPFSKS